MTINLSRHPKYTEAWAIPAYADNLLADGTLDEELKANVLFKRMADVEIVIRFFAFRDKDKIAGSVRGMLDNITKKHRHASEAELKTFRYDFETALDMCIRVFGSDVFRLPAQAGGGKSKLSRPLFDAEMVSMHLHRDRKDEIYQKATRVKAAVLGLAKVGAPTYDLMVGRANTSASIKSRIEEVSKAILGVLDGGA